MFALATLITVVVVVLLLTAVQRSVQRRREEDGAAPHATPRTASLAPRTARALVWGGGVIVPALVIFYLVVETARVGTAVYGPGRGHAPQHLVVEVVGHQFWWQVLYPQHGVETANELYLPAGQTVEVRLTSPDVIHSFWVPRLHGKLDLIPGRQNRLWLRADEPGLFRGQCAEYCGAGHALMALWVEAMPPEQWAAWLTRRRTPQPEPVDPSIGRGREVFFEAGCHACHATRAAPLPAALGAPGPDLTDLGRRRTLAAGTLPNTRSALGDWITDPQRIKPGNRMPPTALEAADLQALLDYLMSLR